VNWNIPWQLLAGIDGNQGDDFFDDGDEGNDDDDGEEDGDDCCWREGGIGCCSCMVATGGHGDGSDARGGGNGSTGGSAGCGCINDWSCDGYPWDDELDEYRVDDGSGDRSSGWSEDDNICPDDCDGGCCCAAGKSVDLITWFGGAEEGEEEDTFPDLGLAEGKFKPWILFKLFML
jgi:hypothetical protein